MANVKRKVSCNNMKLHNLAYWRKIVGLTQRQTGLLIGCNNSNYCLKENGIVDFRRSEMITIQKEFNRLLANMGKGPLILDQIFLP